ncbi:hypothetical protein KEM52_006152 [Ascosphaera acerosa]|nr:hypothetical protein KEM52_006152 [Ascosphaera acerosa]
MAISTAILTVLAATAAPARALLNGVADKPAMGWNSYNHYNCYPNESTYRSNTQALVDLGLADLGYVYSTIDCGWTVKNRTASGELTWDEDLFPSGFPELGEWVHGLGLKFDDNCYSDAATGFPNVNYAPRTSPAVRFANMSQYITTQDRPILFQICEWGVDFPALWAPSIGHSFRIGQDIIPHWRAVARTLNQAVPVLPFTGPGQHADLDMLEVGNSIFTTPEEQTHFSMWAIAKSPLTIGCALSDGQGQISKESLAILKNKDVISYNQDDLGLPAQFRRRWTEERYEVWSEPLSGDRVVAALINWAEERRNLTLDLPDIGLQYAKSLKDVWRHTVAKDVRTSYTSEVEPHGVMLLELGGALLNGSYPAAHFAQKKGTTSTLQRIYARTTSNQYGLEIVLSKPARTGVSITVSTGVAGAQRVDVPHQATTVRTQVALSAGNDNSVIISGPVSVDHINVLEPQGQYYPHTDFQLAGDARRVTCGPGSCSPLGSKTGNIGVSGTATATNVTAASAGAKYVAIDLINNDIALQTAWDWGTNTRNITVAVNDQEPVRIESPLTGRHSELYGDNLGWWDSARHGVLLQGFKEGANKVVIGNVGGNAGETGWAPDFVGLYLMD